MGGRKVTITLSDDEYAALQTTAELNGLGRVAILVKQRAIIGKGKDNEVEPNTRRLEVKMPDWVAVDNYVEQKCFDYAGTFAANAMERMMSQYPLTEAQKRRIESKGGNDSGAA